MGESLKVQMPGDKPNEPDAPNVDHIVQTGENRVEIQVDEENKPLVPGDDRPEWLLEKFKTPADMAKAYGELEKAHTQKSQQLSGGKIKIAAEATEDQAKKAGVDLDALSAEYAEKGELTAESMKALETAGFTADTVSTYIEGQKARAAQTTAALAEIAGGNEGLEATLEWAEGNLDKDEIAAYNSALDSRDINLVKLALSGIVSKYAAANPAEPNLVGGGRTSRSSDVKPFQSQAEIVLAMRDPKYAIDPAYREEVKQRLAVSS